MAAVAVKNTPMALKNPGRDLRRDHDLNRHWRAKTNREDAAVYDCSADQRWRQPVGVSVPLGAVAEFTSKACSGAGAATQTSGPPWRSTRRRNHDFPGRGRASAKRRTNWLAWDHVDIQFAKLHDCFTIAEIIAGEDLGFVAKG